jgi:hypothetical protein
MNVIEELVADYDPAQVSQRVTRRRRLLISRLISLLLTAVILAGLYVWQRSEGQPTSLWVSGVILGLTAAWALIGAVRFVLARRELQSMPSGPAVRIGRAGVQVAGLHSPWSEVVSLGAVKGGLGRGPRLQLTTTSGATAAVPFDQLGARPATLDMTARAYSAGRHGVDLEALEV